MELTRGADMPPTTVLDDIIKGIEPKEVPVEYIIMACVTDHEGNERIVRSSSEIEDLLRDFSYDSNIADARIILNVRKIKKAIIDEVNRIYDDANRGLSADE